jgi:major membrane immunogen (membrane-anchored lipoprotein)
MKSTFFAIAISLVLLGCGQSSTTRSAQPSPSTAVAPVNELGTKQTAGPFEVTLRSSAGTPKASNLDLSADVTQGGQPVQKADVKVELVMPEMREMGSTVVHLKSAGIGTYRGHGDLEMPGKWNAEITVKGADGKDGSATYSLDAK